MAQRVAPHHVRPFPEVQFDLSLRSIRAQPPSALNMHLQAINGAMRVIGARPQVVNLEFSSRGKRTLVSTYPLLTPPVTRRTATVLFRCDWSGRKVAVPDSVDIPAAPASCCRPCSRPAPGSPNSWPCGLGTSTSGSGRFAVENCKGGKGREILDSARGIGRASLYVGRQRL